MKEVIENLMNNSKLPGKRANLELMWHFVETAGDEEIDLCLSYENSDLDNTPEEFILMCGVVGVCVKYNEKPHYALERVEKYANSSSWRVREATAMGIQELLMTNPKEVVSILDDWALKNERYKRCIVADFEKGKIVFERFVECENKNIRWIIKNNLKKNRLVKSDKEWVETLLGLVN